MKPSTKIAIAGLLSAAGSLLNAFAAEFGNAEAATAPETSTPAEPPKTRKTRGTAAEKPTETAPPAETTTTEAAAEEPATTGEGKTYEELRALIKPLVEGGQGEEVKKVIAKYSQSGLKGMETKHHAAFEKDIAALTY